MNAIADHQREHQERAAALCARMLAERRSIRILLGNRYDETAAAWRRGVRTVMARDGVEALAAGLTLSIVCTDQGEHLAARIVLAATLDVIEGKP